jgi:hypothetical protein
MNMFDADALHAMAHRTVMQKDCPGASPNTMDSYWSIAGAADLYSSRINAMVKAGDPACAWWLGTHVSPIPIASEDELALIIKPLGVLPPWLFDAPSFIQPKAGEYSKEQLRAYARWAYAGKTAGKSNIEQRLRALELRAQGDASQSDQWLEFMTHMDTALAEVNDHIDHHRITKLEQVNTAFG